MEESELYCVNWQVMLYTVSVLNSVHLQWSRYGLFNDFLQFFCGSRFFLFRDFVVVVRKYIFSVLVSDLCCYHVATTIGSFLVLSDT